MVPIKCIVLEPCPFFGTPHKKRRDRQNPKPFNSNYVGFLNPNNKNVFFRAIFLPFFFCVFSQKRGETLKARCSFV